MVKKRKKGRGMRDAAVDRAAVDEVAAFAESVGRPVTDWQWDVLGNVAGSIQSPSEQVSLDGTDADPVSVDDSIKARPYDGDRCRVCDHLILTMCQQGTGFCSQMCERAAPVEGGQS